MKKKILIAFVSMLSLVLMPIGAKAASYKDYFTINKYFYSKDVISYVIRIKPTDKLVLLEDKNELQNVNAEFQVLMKDGTTTNEKVLFAEARINENGETVKYIEGFIDPMDLGDVEVDKISKIVININDDYKSKVVIDVDKIEVDENSVVQNTDAIVTEESIGTESTPKDMVEEITKDNNTVSKDVLNEIKTNGNKVTYESKKDDKVSYAWTFDGSKMTTNDLDVNLELIVNAEDKVGISKLIPKTQEKPIILDFKHSGVLPEGTRVKVNISDTYKDGDKVTLYYYNETTKKLEEKVTNIEIKDGYVEFSLEHCSIYTLARVNTAPNNAYTASMNVYLYIGISIISLIGIGVLIKTGKKKIA